MPFAVVMVMERVVIVRCSAVGVGVALHEAWLSWKAFVKLWWRITWLRLSVMLGLVLLLLQLLGVGVPTALRCLFNHEPLKVLELDATTLVGIHAVEQRLQLFQSQLAVFLDHVRELHPVEPPVSVAVQPPKPNAVVSAIDGVSTRH